MKKIVKENLKNYKVLKETLPENTFSVTKMYSTYSYFYSPQYAFNGESHEAWELVFVQSGSVVIETDEYKQELNQGQAFLHKPYEFHKIKSNNVTCQVMFVSFSIDNDKMLERVSGKPLPLNNIQQQYLYDVINNGTILFAGKNFIPDVEEGQEEEFATNQFVKNLLELLLITLVRNDNAKTHKIKANIQSDVAIVNYIIEYLNNNLTKKLSLHDVSNHVGYSVSHISTIFKKSMNVSLINYYIRLKITYAQTLIAEGKMRLKEISEYLCFDSVQYFSTQFKQITGVTPSQYSTMLKTKKWYFNNT